MMVIVISIEDEASVNIRDRLLETDEWNETEEFMGLPTYSHGDLVILQHHGPHIYAEFIDRNISEFLGKDVEVIIFASKHKSESGRKSLTVHAVGNYGKAEYGGKDHVLSVPHPALMTGALRIMAERNTLSDFSVSYEVTHHGPYLNTPSFFIEIGSTEKEWEDRRAGKIIAETLLDLIRIKSGREDTVIGIGGGHYAPRFTELALLYRISFGHMAAKYAVENLHENMLAQMVEKSGAEYAYFHKDGLKRSKISEISDILKSLDIERIREKDMEKR